MCARRSFFDALWAQLATPKVSEEELHDCLARIRAQLPKPVFWLLGKAQSGKSSIIQALTGSTQAEVGNGFVRCTDRSQLYPFPNADECLLQFLDTRGLGEVDYDPTAEMAVFADQAHLLVVVVKALDHAQQPVIEAATTVLRQKPTWPLLVVQTCLHEGYGRADAQHTLPYPFSDASWPDGVPRDLARSLHAQRELFADLARRPGKTRFVPVDFTQAEDGYTPAAYGLDACWEAIEELLPHGLRGMITQFQEGRSELRDMHFRAAHAHVLSYALAAGAAGAVPVPFVDIPLVAAIQAKMFHAVASIYDQPLSASRVAEIAGALGLGFAGRMGVRELLKFLPGVGSALAGAYAAASTYALGRTLCVYFSHWRAGDVPSQETFRALYQEEFQKARSRLKEYLGGIRAPREDEPQ